MVGGQLAGQCSAHLEDGHGEIARTRVEEIGGRPVALAFVAVTLGAVALVEFFAGFQIGGYRRGLYRFHLYTGHLRAGLGGGRAGSQQRRKQKETGAHFFGSSSQVRGVEPDPA